jgi:hypothetical protein
LYRQRAEKDSLEALKELWQEHKHAASAARLRQKAALQMPFSGRLALHSKKIFVHKSLTKTQNIYIIK